MTKTRMSFHWQISMIPKGFWVTFPLWKWTRWLRKLRTILMSITNRVGEVSRKTHEFWDEVSWLLIGYNLSWVELISSWTQLTFFCFVVDLNPDISCYELREGNDILLRDVKFYVEGNNLQINILPCETRSCQRQDYASACLCKILHLRIKKA